jgi:hypothetical protein
MAAIHGAAYRRHANGEVVKAGEDCFSESSPSFESRKTGFFKEMVKW